MIIKRIVNGIDKSSNCIGVIVGWSVFLLLFLVVLEVASRFIFNSPTIWSFTITTWIYGAHFMLTAAYAHLCQQHVRIDLLYRFFSPKGQAILDIISYLIFFLPFFIMLTITGTKFATTAWILGEHQQGLYSPHMGPIKTVIPIAAALLLLQGISDFIKKIVFLIKEDTI